MKTHYLKENKTEWYSVEEMFLHTRQAHTSTVRVSTAVGANEPLHSLLTTGKLGTFSLENI